MPRKDLVPPKTTLRVELQPTLPLDPLRIQTMSDYDLCLCLYRTWFEMDSARRVRPGIVAAWAFHRKRGVYKFTISERARWSDGSPMTSDQLLQNLQRAVQLKTSYGQAIAGIVFLNSARAITDREFEIQTVDRRPSKSLLQRMGSSFLAPVHPSDWTQNYALKGNVLTSGPYRIQKKTQTKLILSKNPHDFFAAKTRAPQIEIRLNSNTHVQKFVNGKGWPSLLQTATLMPKELADRIRERRLPFWTRDHDRVSILYPTGSNSLAANRELLKVFGVNWAGQTKMRLPFHAKVAKSLQPKGYPLRVDLHYIRKTGPDDQLKAREVQILARQSLQVDFQRPFIDEVFRGMGHRTKWILAESFSELLEWKSKQRCDFVLMNFGVADPEPATWMGMLLQARSPFLDVEEGDLGKFRATLKCRSRKPRISRFKALLKRMGERGSYVPLFHFSTFSIGRPGLSFRRIKESDETVDYSKVILR